MNDVELSLSDAVKSGMLPSVSSANTITRPATAETACQPSERIFLINERYARIRQAEIEKQEVIADLLEVVADAHQKLADLGWRPVEIPKAPRKRRRSKEEMAAEKSAEPASAPSEAATEPVPSADTSKSRRKR